MLTSSAHPHRSLLVEAGVAAALVAGASLIWNPADPFLSNLPLHPGWLAILALAARYGASGLFVGLGAVLGALTGAGALAGEPLSLGLAVRLSDVGDALALGAGLPIAWVAMMQEGRRREQQARLDEVEEKLRGERETADALRDAVLSLRAKNDRVDGSLTFWRRIASRLDQADATKAARAALELCAVRTGARASLVRLRRGSRWENLAWRGSWSAESPVPADIFADRTIDAAFERGSLVVASDVEQVGPEDSDLAAPVIDAASGRIVGVLALRGVPLARLGPADLRDVREVAAWLSSSFARKALGAAAGSPPAPRPSPSPAAGRKARIP